MLSHGVSSEAYVERVSGLEKEQCYRKRKK
jgi:hypothetical protein